MTTEQMIDVMQAYVDGEQIEFKKKEGVSEYYEWELLDIVPSWDWHQFNYRVKPKNTYRPYKNAEEFITGQNERGKYLREKSTNNVVLPLAVNNRCVYVIRQQTLQGVLYEDLFNYYTWRDHTPCGVKEE